MVSKTCSICKVKKPISKVHKQSRSKNGYRGKCKECRKSNAKTPENKAKAQNRNQKYRKTENGRTIRSNYQVEYRENGPGRDIQRRYDQSEQGKERSRINSRVYRARWPEKSAAHAAVSSLVHQGKIPRARDLRCHKCEEPADSYHHHLGYEKEHRLDIIPLCYSCHANTYLQSSHQ